SRAGRRGARPAAGGSAPAPEHRAGRRSADRPSTQRAGPTAQRAGPTGPRRAPARSRGWRAAALVAERCSRGRMVAGPRPAAACGTLRGAVLHLRSHTPEGWASWALAHLDEILLDHAHCEKKAASTALNLIFRYTQHEPLVEPLSQLAREELEHFEQVLGHLRRRGR